MTDEDVVGAVRAVLIRTESPLARAELVEQILYAAYDVTKSWVPGGEGLDGEQEREGLGRVLMAGIKHADEQRKLMEARVVAQADNVTDLSSYRTTRAVDL